MEAKEYMDGIVLVSVSWAFLKPIANFTFQNKITVRKVNKGDIKGLRRIGETQAAYKIQLGNCMDGELSLVNK